MSELVTDLTRGVYRRQYCGYIKGQRINNLSVPAECWFWRLHAAADDFGNSEADPTLMHANTVGRRKGVTVDQVSRFYEESTQQDLLRQYEVGGEPFYHVVGFMLMQPAGKNGKRVRRVPPSPWDIDEINGVNPEPIQVNPDSSSASHSDPHSHSHSHSHARGRHPPPRENGEKLSKIQLAVDTGIAKEMKNRERKRS